MTAPDEHMQLAAWLRNPWQKCDDTPRGPIPEWQAALMFEAANVIECYAKSTSLAQAAVAAAYEAAAQVVLGSNLGLDISDIADDVRALATPDQIAALAAKVDASQAPNPAVNGGRYQSDTITLSRAEVKALMEAARAAWDESCANHEKAPPIKYLAPYGGLVRLHTALATLRERMK